MQYFNFSSLIEQYSVDFKVLCESKGSYDDSGEYADGEITEYIFHGAIVAFSENKVYRSEGRLTSQDKLLIMQEPINKALHGAKVIHDNRQYRIEGELENAEFTGVYQYTLKYVSAFDRERYNDRL